MLHLSLKNMNKRNSCFKDFYKADWCMLIGFFVLVYVITERSEPSRF